MILFDHIPEALKNIGDALSVVVALGTLAQVLPSIAALLTIIWTGIRIYDRFTGHNAGGDQ